MSAARVPKPLSVALLGAVVVAAASCSPRGASTAVPATPAGAALTASATPATAGDAAPTRGSPSVAAGGRGDPGEVAPDFALPAAGGGTFRLSAQRGRVVVLDFLAPGCVDCSVEVRTLEAIARRFEGDGVEVVVVDVSGLPVGAVAPYYRDLGGLHLIYVGDRTFDVVRAYEVVSLGTTVVIDPRGQVAFRDRGSTPSAVLPAAVAGAVG